MIRPNDHTGYFPVIHLLRGVAVLMVALLHFACWGEGTGQFFSKDSWIFQLGVHGRMGVYIFFVISGFVITYSMVIHNYTIRSFFRFMAKRSIRIEIPYIASIGMFFIVAFLYYKWDGRVLSFDLKQFLLHFFYLIPFTKYEWYNVIYWTLSVEFQFYILMALLVPLFIHKNKIIQTIALVLFASLPFLYTLQVRSAFVHIHTGMFSIGIVTCLYYLKKVNLFQTLLILVIGFSGTIYARGLEVALFAIGTAAVIYFINIENRVTRFFGEISYSMYLLHGYIGNTLIWLAIEKYHWPLPHWVIFLLAFITSIAGSYIFWRLIERPSKRLSGKIKL